MPASHNGECGALSLTSPDTICHKLATVTVGDSRYCPLHASFVTTYYNEDGDEETPVTSLLLDE